MAFFARAADFLTDRVAPHLVIGPGPRNQPTRAELENEAQRELQARIDLGRPGAEEAVRLRPGPPPDWAAPQPARRPTRDLDVLTVRLDALGATVPAEVEVKAAGPAPRPSRSESLERS